MTESSHHKRSRKFRADFDMKPINVDEDSGIVEVLIRPDPRRYEEINCGDETVYKDRYVGGTYSLNDLAQLSGLPIYHLPAHIRSASEYSESRRAAVYSELATGQYSPPDEHVSAHQNLNLNNEARELGFLSVDICGATALRQSNPVGFDKAYEIFLKEMGTTVGHFSGTLLKTKGDGFIAYIDHPSFTSLCDAIVDLGLAIIKVARNSLNPTFAEHGLPQLKIRVGADYGEAMVKAVFIPKTGFSSQDVISDALNRAVKIEESCEDNEFRIGRALFELIHVQWLERCQQVSFDGDSIGITRYEVYKVD